MKSYRTAVASLLVASAAAQSNVTCVNGVHVIVARASEEDPGFGYLGTVKDEVLAMIPESDAVAVPYPATIEGPPIYFESVPEGAGNMTLLVREYGDACPGHKMVLMGYSQGAHVVGDVLIGNVNTAFQYTTNWTGIESSYLENIFAVIMMGDPTNVANQSFLIGNSTRNGIFPRANVGRWAERGLVAKIASYCDADDTYCDSGVGEYGHVVHNGYVPEYGSRAAQFVTQRYTNTSSATNGTSTNGTSTNTTSTTPGTTTSSGRATSSTAPGNGASDLKVSAVSTTLTGLLAYGLAYVLLL